MVMLLSASRSQATIKADTEAEAPAVTSPIINSPLPDELSNPVRLRANK